MLLMTPASSLPVREAWRPRHRFTPQRNWINDPNGLVFVDGTYHLFYQYNPHGDQWGDISWGHATSSDLVHWQEHPVALPATPTEMVFSGSVVVDTANSSGLAPAGHAGPLLVALYTSFDPLTKIQAQCLAYSLDQGLSFTRYGGNPVLDIGSTEFRDPKVFWHQATQRWVMLVVMALEQQVWIYTSTNLRQWARVSTFGPAGSCEGNIWEMPDLFPLPVGGEAGTQAWVLIVSVNHGSLWGGSGVQYFVGDFDGQRFTADAQTWWPASTGQAAALPPLAERARWADAGRDFYAPMTFSHVPDGRVLWLGWMSNWAYAKELPTAPWRGQQSMVRELSLVRTEGGLRLRQQPAPEVAACLRGQVMLDARDLTAAEAMARVRAASVQAGSLRIQLTMDRKGLNGPAALSVLADAHEQVKVGFDPRGDCYFVERGARVPRFSGDGERHTAARLSPHRTEISLDLWVDQSSIELFADDGEIVISDLAYNDPRSRQVGLAIDGAGCRVQRLVVTLLDSTR